MRIKYYIRGLATGLLIATLLFLLSTFGSNKNISDDEIIQRAKALGMVMQEDVLFTSSDSSEEDNSVEDSMESSDVSEESSEEVSQESSESTEVETSNDSTIIDENSDTTEISKVETSENETNTDSVEGTNDTTEVAETTEITFTIERGMTSTQIADMLESKGVIDDAKAFQEYIKENGNASYLDIGEFTVTKGISYAELLSEISVEY